MNSNASSGIESSSRPTILEKELGYTIVGAFFQVYNELGFGFLEALYARALEIDLKSKGLLVEREYPVPILFRANKSASTDWTCLSNGESSSK